MKFTKSKISFFNSCIHIFRKTLVFLFASFVLSSCKKDFLQVVDTTVLLKEGYVTDLATTEQFLNGGIYIELGNFYMSGLNFHPYPEIMADNMKPANANTNVFVSAYNWNFYSAESNIVGSPTAIWLNLYKVIRNCNYVIQKAEEFKEQDLLKSNKLIGQALAIRAMLHFTLCNVFGQTYAYTPDASHIGVPYITSADIKESGPREPVRKVYEYIIEDLLHALSVLDKQDFNRDLMNFNSASALLSRVYLFKGDFINAKKIAIEIMQNRPLLTINYPADLYTTRDNEILFRIGPGNNATDLSVSSIGYYSSQAGGLRYVATADLVQLFRENLNDKRNSWIKDTLGLFQIRKFPKAAVGINPAPEKDYYPTLFRSSELCLNAAEAFANLNITDSARYYIDLIRKRANPTVSSITASGPALLDSIYKERRKEMAFDGLRFWDLQRWRKGVDRTDVFGPAPKNMPYPSDKAVAALPKSDVDLLGLQQNPGY